MAHRSRSHIAAGVAVVVLGSVLALAFGDVDTPVAGLRQVGIIVAVTGIIDGILALAGRDTST